MWLVGSLEMQIEALKQWEKILSSDEEICKNHLRCNIEEARHTLENFLEENKREV